MHDVSFFASMYCVSADMRWPMRTPTWFTTVIVDNAIAVHTDCTWARDSTRDVARRYARRVEHPAIWTCSDSSGCSVTRLVQAHPVPDRERTSAFASWTLSRSALQRTNTVLKNCYGNPFWPMHLHGITIIQNGPSLILSIPLNRQSKSMNLFTLN